MRCLLEGVSNKVRWCSSRCRGEACEMGSEIGQDRVRVNC